MVCLQRGISDLHSQKGILCAAEVWMWVLSSCLLICDLSMVLSAMFLRFAFCECVAAALASKKFLYLASAYSGIMLLRGRLCKGRHACSVHHW